MKTYLVIRWNPGFSRARFNAAKAQGLIQTSFDTTRKRLDELAAIVSYRGTQPPELKPADILAGPFTVEEMRAYLAANAAAWEEPVPVTAVLMMAAEEAGIVHRSPGEPPDWFWWLLGAAAVGAAATHYREVLWQLLP